MASTPNYDINYNDKRFTEVEADKKQALTDVEKTYGGMISNSDKYFQAQIDASKQWADKQTQLQNEQTDFAIQEIEQQKAQAAKDYTKEQSGAYVDWQKESNQYGANAEQMAAQGLANSGYSESSQVAMFNTYQNRVTSARESYNVAIQNYNNAITEARLQNNSILAEIAYEALQQQLELSLQGFQYKNQLIIEKANKKTELGNIYHARYQDVLGQINEENKLAETVRQFGVEQGFKEAQLRQQKEIADAQLAEEQRQFNILHPASSSSGSSGSSGGSIRKSSSKKSSSSSSKKSSSGSSSVKHGGGGTKFNVSASTYINELIKSGASKDKVSNEISLALRNGAITKREAATLRNKFTPRGIQY